MKLHNVTGRDFRELDVAADPPRDILIPAGGSADLADATAKRILAAFPNRFSKSAPKAAVEVDEEGGES